MTGAAETVFAIDSPALPTAPKAFQGIRGVTTAVTGSNDRIKAMDSIGAISKFLSAVDNIFGSNLASYPANSDSSFAGTVAGQESVTVNIPVALSGARFTALFYTYFDVAGAMNAAFSVDGFSMDGALRGNKSLCMLKPDPDEGREVHNKRSCLQRELP